MMLGIHLTSRAPFALAQSSCARASLRHGLMLAPKSRFVVFAFSLAFNSLGP